MSGRVKRLANDRKVSRLGWLKKRKQTLHLRCSNYGLSTAGKKEDLVERILSHLKASNSPVDEQTDNGGEDISSNAWCSGDIDVMADMRNKRALSLFLIVKCRLCGFTCTPFTSRKTADKYVAGSRHSDVNLCAALAFNKIGKGYLAISAFCTIMNMCNKRQK